MLESFRPSKNGQRADFSVCRGLPRLQSDRVRFSGVTAGNRLKLLVAGLAAGANQKKGWAKWWKGTEVVISNNVFFLHMTAKPKRALRTASLSVGGF